MMKTRYMYVPGRFKNLFRVAWSWVSSSGHPLRGLNQSNELLEPSRTHASLPLPGLWTALLLSRARPGHLSIQVDQVLECLQPPHSHAFGISPASQIVQGLLPALLAPATADGFLASHGLLWRSYFLLVLMNTPIDPCQTRTHANMDLANDRSIWTLGCSKMHKSQKFLGTGWQSM